MCSISDTETAVRIHNLQVYIQLKTVISYTGYSIDPDFSFIYIILINIYVIS